MLMLAACFAATACCFFWFALAVLTCFCFACFWTAFGDLSPIVVFLLLKVCSPAQ